VLKYGEKPPFSSGYFRELSESILDDEDKALLQYCGLHAAEDDPAGTSSPFINDWLSWRKSYRYILTNLRAAKLGRQAGVEDIGDMPQLQQAVTQAIAMESPLEAEQFLDRTMWDALDTFEGLDYFSVNTIYSYLIKLQILERGALFEPEEGFKEYQSLYNHILETGEQHK
jgi:hypothetical protein